MVLPITAQNRLVVSHDETTDHLTVHLHTAGSHQSATAGPFANPLTPKDRAQLRWYLEEYLKFPVGIYPDEARKVEAAMVEWGGRMFELLFGPGRPARDVYILARQAGLRKFDFEVNYRAPQIGIIPWELLYDTEAGYFLVHQFASFSRFRDGGSITWLEPRPPEQALNVLVVIARPYGERDVPYRTVARPVMEILHAPQLSRRIHVEILRPPTFENLQSQLARRREDDSEKAFFDILHFDGHGGFDASDRGSDELMRVFDIFEGPPGKLLFETEDGSEDAIEVETLRQQLQAHKVPMVVLNACRSGMETLDEPALQEQLALQTQLRREKPEEIQARLAEQNRRIASVASTLIDGGADGVVAMGYIVRARAAAIFMRAFYYRVLLGGTAAEAVTTGRLALREHPARPTSFGELPLKDWLIPVYHERMGLRIFQPPPPNSDAEELLEAFLKGLDAEAPTGEPLPHLPRSPRHGFVGRDLELLEIERGLRRSDLAGVAIVGLGGNGKTTLATGAARWLRATNAPQVEGGVYFHAFVDRDGDGNAIHPSLAQLIRAIGLQNCGPSFELEGSLQQREKVITHLRQEPCLLILDNVETAAGMGELPALLSEEERAEFREFLAEVCHPHGRTRLLITSRRSEEWLELTLKPLRLGGLDPEAAGELAHKILATALSLTDLQERFSNEGWSYSYGQLLSALHGHPLGLQIVLPHLRDQEPNQVLAAFEAGDSLLDQPLDGMDHDRERTLSSCLNYSFSTLPKPTQRLLEVLGFFRETVDTEILALLSRESQDIEVPERLRRLTSEHWQSTLEQAATIGVVEPLYNSTLFRLHTLLPWFLTGRLHKVLDREALESTFRRRITIWAKELSGVYEKGGLAESAVKSFKHNQATLFHALSRTSQRGEMESVLDTFQCLYDLLEATGQAPTARQLRSQMAGQFKSAGEMPSSTPAGKLWWDLEFKRANELLKKGNPIGAKRVYEKLAERIAMRNDRDAASIFHQLGMTTQDQRQHEEAQKWYQKSLDIKLRIGDQSGAAISYHQLGMIAQKLRRFDKAREWYQKSLDIKLPLGNEAGKAATYHQLGRVAEEVRELDQAQEWYQKSLDINLRIGNEAVAASSYHQLGRVSQLRGYLEEAETWYRKSLHIKLRLGNEAGAATSYHQLGGVALGMRHFEQARAWYLKSLDIKGQLGNEAGKAASYRQLGQVAEETGHFEQAQDWYLKGLDVCTRFDLAYDSSMAYDGLGTATFSLGQGIEATAYTLKALALYQRWNNPHDAQRQRDNLRFSLRQGLVTLHTIAKLWQAEMGSTIPKDVVDFLTSDSESTTS